MRNLFKILSVLALAFALSAPASALQVSNNLLVTNPGKGLIVKGGANARVGTAICNGTSAVTVANTSFNHTDIVSWSLNTVGGTVGALPAIQTVTDATGFTFKCTASDTSTYNFLLVAQN